MKLSQVLSILAAMQIAISASAAEFEQVHDRLATLVGSDMEVAVASTRVEGIVQITAGTDVFFMTEDGQFFIQGRLVDLETQDDLTELGKRDIRRSLLENFDISTLITYGPTNPDHEILIFTDTDCGYCRRLHEMIDEYIEAGIAVRYAAFPRAGIGSSTYDDLVGIWCSEDVNHEMDRAQLGQSIPGTNCDSPVESHYELGRKMGISGTPFMVAANGETFSGIVPARDLRQRLDQTGTDGS